jgi:hypothetical protein
MKTPEDVVRFLTAGQATGYNAIDAAIVRGDIRLEDVEELMLVAVKTWVEHHPGTVEILHQRDPDSSCVVTLFLDGVETDDFTLEDIDPGAGYSPAEWDERVAEVRTSYSPAFRTATLLALGESNDSPYITDYKD